MKITEKGSNTLNQTRIRYKYLIERVLKEVNEDEVIKFFQTVEEILNSTSHETSS
ncbi:hypothetical protein [Sulfuracidifex metallicus]|uniref:hypothetical protein n=1 Tax=Sulfuracidifex metallicus TaxID=47303 RepID=UPI000AD09B98|nr:hypothetical protein [Sulfuracidifex metallicus]